MNLNETTRLTLSACESLGKALSVSCLLCRDNIKIEYFHDSWKEEIIIETKIKKAQCKKLR